MNELFKEELKDYSITIGQRLATIFRCLNDVEFYIEQIENLDCKYNSKEKVLKDLKLIRKYIGKLDTVNYLNYLDIKGSDKNV